MRHFEMAYATLFIETLILYTFQWHDQPHFVYGSMYFDIYLSTLSMDMLIYFDMFIINKWYITVSIFIIDSYYMSSGLYRFMTYKNVWSI